MDQDRPGGAVMDGAQDTKQLVHVMPVDGTDIGKAQLLEHGATDGHAFQHFLRAAGAFLEGRRQQADRTLRGGLQLLKRRTGVEAGEVGGHGTNRRCDRHFIVVQHDEEPLFQVPGVVQRLIRHARAHRAVADDGHRIACVAAKVARHGKAQRGGDRGGGMGGAEGVIGAFRPLGKARQARFLAQGADTIAPPGQDLVRIALMSDVPDDLVARRVEDGVQRYGQFDNAETRAQMPAGDGDGADRFCAQFVGEVAQVGIRQGLEVGGDGHTVKRRCLRSVGQSGGPGVVSAGLAGIARRNNRNGLQISCSQPP